ncbi:sugar porter family MFS transporter [Maribacter sp. 2210JD10-5]|uniref:sugar porter family MFS transporter n=1 Tax=Maribacter sp. 2210JD10-5 TaxID=3386272 RepID=UPI0039BCA46B
MNFRFLTLISFATALGGFLFGFDTAVISGANLYIQPYFELNEWAFGFTVSSMLIGCALGGIFFGAPSDRYGRKPMLIITAILFLISAVGSALATSLSSFIIFRLIGGLGVGGASMLSPNYIAEVSPAKVRGKMVSLNQLTIVLGITVAFFSNYFLDNLPETINWRWMLGVEAIPAFLFLIFMFFVPESPRWLIVHKKNAKALKVLEKINGKENAQQIQNEIESDINNEADEKLSFVDGVKKLFGNRYKKFTFIAIVLAVLQQVSGINIVMYYAPNIFKSIGLGSSGAIFQSLSIGVIMSLFTIIAMFLVDKVGRKKLLTYGAIGMAFSLCALGVSFSMDVKNPIVILLLILSYIAFFSISAGPIVWVIISEILPNEVRSLGIGVATFFLWLANYIVTLTFPVLLNTFTGSMSGFAFVLYGVLSFLLFLFVKYKVPETKGKSLEEIRDLV